MRRGLAAVEEESQNRDNVSTCPSPFNSQFYEDSKQLHSDCPIEKRTVCMFPGGSVVQSPPANAGDAGSTPWVRKIPWRRKWKLAPVLLPSKSHGQRSLVSYSPWGHKESDTADRLNIST